MLILSTEQNHRLNLQHLQFEHNIEKISFSSSEYCHEEVNCHPEIVIFYPSSNTFDTYKIRHDPTVLNLSPSGDLLLFLDENSQINLLNLLSGKAEPLIKPDSGDIRHFDPAWSPDGNYITFSATYPPPASINYDLYIFYTDTATLTQLTEGLIVSNVTWSPDSDHVAFTGAETNGDSDVYIMNIKTKDLINVSWDRRSYAPSWSANGTLISFLSKHNKSDSIYIVDSRTLDTLDIFRLEGRKSRPLWTNDDMLVYSTVINRNTEFITYDMSSDLYYNILNYETIGYWGILSNGEMLIYTIVERVDELNNRLCVFELKLKIERCFDDIPVPFTLTDISLTDSP